MKVDTLVPVFNLDLSNQDFLIIIYEGSLSLSQTNFQQRTDLKILQPVYMQAIQIPIFCQRASINQSGL